MRVTATTAAPADTGADTLVAAVFEGEDVAHDVEDGALGAALERGEARRRFRHLAVLHAGGRRWILAGLGRREDFDAERARLVAHVVLRRAREVGTRRLCWELPHHVDDALVAGLVEGTLLSDYRFERFKRTRGEAGEDDDRGDVEELIVSAHHDVAAAAERAALLAEATNAARDLQHRPANDLTPTRLADRAARIAAGAEGLTLEVLGREQLAARGMGAFAAVARGTREEPACIVLRYEGPGARGPLLGLVGKAVTFDAGGISIKPAAGMQEMKFDMSGGAAVLEALAAIAARRLPVRIVGVVGATENLPSGRAMKPGDIVTAMDGTTIEVNNTDAEGRMVLADCLLLARGHGAERLVDLATLTGGVVTALGSVYAGGFGNDEDWYAAVAAAGARAGEPVWRLPLHRRYAKAVEGRYADLTNTGPNRKAHPVMGAEFLHRFAGEVPWVHLDIAGVASDADVPYMGKGGTGWGVRLLVALAEDLARDRHGPSGD